MVGFGWPGAKDRRGLGHGWDKSECGNGNGGNEQRPTAESPRWSGEGHRKCPFVKAGRSGGEHGAVARQGHLAKDVGVIGPPNSDVESKSPHVVS
jgi:hypothetical protein